MPATSRSLRRTYRAIHLQVLLVLGKLKLDPNGLAVAVTVPCGELLNGFLGLATGVKPSGTLGEEEGKHYDKSREDHLKPNGNQPGVVALDIETAAGGARSQDGANKPGSVAETSDNATESGVNSLDHPDWAGGSSNIDTEAEQESAAHHLALRGI